MGSSANSGMEEESLLADSSGDNEIRGLLSFRDDSLVIVGTPQPKLYLFNIISKQITEELLKNLQKCNEVLPLRSLYHNKESRHKFYSLHTSYFIEWNFELLLCEGFSKVKNLRHICTAKSANSTHLYISTDSPTVLCDRLPVSHQPAFMMDTRLSVVSRVRGLEQGQVAVAGNQGMI